MTNNKLDETDGIQMTEYVGTTNAPKLRHQLIEEKGPRKFMFSSNSKRRDEPDLNSDLTTRFDPTEDEGTRYKLNIAVNDNIKFVANCCLWYISSSLSNNSGKSILNDFNYPITLTFIQFGLVGFWCYLISVLFKSTHIRKPTKDIIETIIPLALFLIIGHIFSSIAISQIPVSLVHTIKALAPLFTVLFYRVIYKIEYTKSVYISLLPLTIGVIMTCSLTYSNNMIGLTCALLSCLIFVTQNIFSKQILFKESRLNQKNPNKLDKINVLFYSSTISFIFMIPLWFYYDGSLLLLSTSSTLTSTPYFHLFLNGTMNFSQNWFAFTTLTLTSTVTYSILSLLKRIFVIVMSIIWFGQQISITQSFGILLTFIGLYMYQNTKLDVVRGENKIISRNFISLPK